MKKSKVRLFWSQVLDDRDLVFFTLGFFTWLANFVAELYGVRNSWLWIMAEVAVPIFFIGGLALYLHKYYRLTSQIISTKHLPIVFVVGKPQYETRDILASAQETITYLTGFKAFNIIEETFNVRYDYLLSYEKKRLPPDITQWKNFIEDAERRIRLFSDPLPGNKVYHIFVDGPASLSLGLGSVFGSKHPLVVYQRIDGQYKPVINLMEEVRRIKQVISEAEYQYIHVSYPPSFTPDIAVVLDMASHPALGYVKAYLKQKGLKMEVVEVSNTYGGNLTEEDWIKVVQELHSVFQRLQVKEEVERFHLFHSMPVALAFGLGMASGNFIPIIVYNWEAQDETYYPVLKLNELESFI